MVALVVGYGSIGSLHARLLAELGHEVAVVSSRKVEHARLHSSMADAVAAERPEYVVIANGTARHREALASLAEMGYAGTVLVEKPVFDRTAAVPANSFRDVFVGYNLRFHPAMRRLKQLTEREDVISVQAYVGQYLPEWRPGSDYRRSYSAHANRGGGVLRDLSHELDYLGWLLGGWRRVAALGGHLSPLETDTEDVFALMLVHDRCPIVTAQLNYLDRMSRRSIIVNTSAHTIEADLVGNSITVDRDRESFGVDRDLTYRAMHQAILSGERGVACTLEEGLETVRLFEAAERAAESGQWVSR